jgi:hypothetical protein
VSAQSRTRKYGDKGWDRKAINLYGVGIGSPIKGYIIRFLDGVINFSIEGQGEQVKLQFASWLNKDCRVVKPRGQELIIGFVAARDKYM